MSADRPDPLGALAAFARIAYSEAVTVVLVSLATILAALPIVTLGPALVAAVETVTHAVETRTSGRVSTERERLVRFKRVFRRTTRRGLALSVPPVGAGIATVAYLGIAFGARNTAMLVGAAAGGYAIVVSLAVTLRAATLLVRSPTNLAGRMALRNAAFHLLDRPRYAVLHASFLGVLCLLCVAVGVAVPLLLAGLLAVAEVASFEERDGIGAHSVVSAYRGDLIVDRGGEEA